MKWKRALCRLCSLSLRIVKSKSNDSFPFASGLGKTAALRAYSRGTLHELSEKNSYLVFHYPLPSWKCFGKIEQSGNLLLLLNKGVSVKASQIWLTEGSEWFLLPWAAGETWLQLTSSLPVSEAECKFLRGACRCMHILCTDMGDHRLTQGRRILHLQIPT